MPSPHSSLAQRPLILAVGFHRLQGLLRDIAPEYQSQADIEVISSRFEQAVGDVQRRQRQRRVDAVVAAGSNGAYLRERLEVPVVAVRVDGYDVLRALASAREAEGPMAVLLHGAVPPELSGFLQAFQLDVQVRSYVSGDEARAHIDDLARRGIKAVVAPGLATDLAQGAGMLGIFLYSPEAVRRSFEDALHLARAARQEATRSERLDTIIDQLQDGVIAVDRHERIETVNPAMERILGQPRSQLLGKRLGEVQPELSLERTLRQGVTENDRVARVGDTLLVTHRRPILEQGLQTGAVLIGQESTAIRRSERRLRGRAAPGGGARYRLSSLIGGSAAIGRVVQAAERYARSDATLLVTGESGTGKEIVAQGIHQASRRRQGPFVALNCGALPESLLESELFGYEDGAFTGARRGGKPGLFEAAHGGTLFLDEIGEVSAPLQARLLRVLQEREVLRLGATEPTPVDVRIIAATHEDLRGRLDAGSFRLDLYFRLNLLRLHLPPLRDRDGDAARIAAALLDTIAARLDVPAVRARPFVDALLAAAADYPWPGNVRELENFVERMVIAASLESRPTPALVRDLLPELFDPDVISLPTGARQTALSSGRPSGRFDIPWRTAAFAPAEHGLPPSLDAPAALLLQTLRDTAGNREEACRQLGISRTTLWRRVKALRDAGFNVSDIGGSS